MQASHSLFPEGSASERRKKDHEGAIEEDPVGIGDSRLYGLLEQKQKAADTDAALARSIEKAKNITLSYFFHITEKEVGHLTEQQITGGENAIANGRFQMVRAKKGADESPLIHAYAAQPNIPRISEAGENGGYFNAFPDSDGVFTMTTK